MSRPIIALLTDFGTRDHYVGTMKGVVLGVCRDATLVDITHDVPPQDVLAGALELSASYRYFPSDTIFLAVVDPGVGSQRRGLAARAGDYTFVGPDNGLFTTVFHEAAPALVVELKEQKYARSAISRTFEGRDRFAPAAGWLAAGVELASLGPRISDYHLLDVPVPDVRDDAITGAVLRVDRFGNLITNIDRATFDNLARRGPVRVRVGDHEIAHVVTTYSEARSGESCALFGSTDHLEIAVNGGSAADRLARGRGTPVSVERWYHARLP